ncbi:kinetochore Sim4 complex subunit FTA2-domain-containing protein [Xylariaceae sp. FL1019]|nr:kinetochore Sim4 complex subunit FTA2-domain-containing protein [Xylariaceae sp. FL1019]
MVCLPDLPGPRIPPFSNTNHSLKIVFLQRLGIGGDATVWKIEIDQQVYALKIFGFGNFLYYESKVPKILQENGVTSELIHPYRDPFTSECRAFGRLQETNNEHLAVKCFGYIILTEAQEQLLINAGGANDTPIERDDERLAGEPLRCIVKEYIETPGSIQHHQFPQLIRDLYAVHRLGIVVSDIRAGNCILGDNADTFNNLNGVMMDFSRSLTVPHPYLLPAFQERLYTNTWKSQPTARGDEENFDAMIDRYNRMIDMGLMKGPRVWTRLRPNDKFKARLRQRSDDSIKIPRYPRVRAELYDWQGAQRERDRLNNDSNPVVAVKDVEDKQLSEEAEKDPSEQSDRKLPPKDKGGKGKKNKKKRKTKAKKKRH